ncbi:hypothetical protein LCGC14_3002020 [marine sediment metagenome]|uniref:DUF4326 domain-containing protein n=1 Tax=marine sediment metagenome TaxID=412755 RepID=A0A0F8X174_9ZZZZ
MVMPKVLNKRTDTIPAGAVYVGRPSKWGNPITIRELKVLFPNDTPLELQEKAVGWYKEYLVEDTRMHDTSLTKQAQEELKGKDLVCWCSPLPCHADVLLELANKEE